MLVVIGASTSGGESSGGGSDSASSGDTSTATATTETNAEEDHGNPAENASDDNTPSVGPNGSVEVDTLRWRLGSAKATRTIGDQEYGLGAKANGAFVVAELSVTNNKSDSVTLTSEVVNLVAGDNTYDADSDAETALIGEGADTFFSKTLDPE